LTTFSCAAAAPEGHAAGISPIISRIYAGFPPHETILRGPRNHLGEPTKPTGNKAGVNVLPTGGKDAMGAQMNHSIHSADRSTHLKIVVVALFAGIVVAGLGISARSNVDYSQTAHVVKAGKMVTVTSSDASLVR
jgi:hypothetical protein